MTTVHFDRVHGLAARALAAGAILRKTTRLSWDVSSGCQNPKTVEVWSRPSKDRAFHGSLRGTATNSIMTVELDVKCRVCDTCLAKRAAMWRHRNEAAFIMSAVQQGRTWWGTLTFNASEHQDNRLRAIDEFNRRGGDPWAKTFEALSEHQQFILEERQAYRKVQLYFKRVRKQSDAKFKYCIVTERHKTGLPHFHILLYEATIADKVVKRTLEGQWSVHGFSKWREAKTAEKAAYCTKYLSKDPSARVRGSKDLGRSPAQIGMKSDTPEGIEKQCFNVMGNAPTKGKGESQGTLTDQLGIKTPGFVTDLTVIMEQDNGSQVSHLLPGDKQQIGQARALNDAGPDRPEGPDRFNLWAERQAAGPRTTYEDGESDRPGDPLDPQGPVVSH